MWSLKNLRDAVRRLMPTRAQWRRWSLPNRLTVVGTAASLAGIPLAILLAVFPMPLGRPPDSSLDSGINRPKVPVGRVALIHLTGGPRAWGNDRDDGYEWGNCEISVRVSNEDFAPTVLIGIDLRLDDGVEQATIPVEDKRGPFHGRWVYVGARLGGGGDYISPEDMPNFFRPALSIPPRSTIDIEVSVKLHPPGGTLDTRFPYFEYSQHPERLGARFPHRRQIKIEYTFKFLGAVSRSTTPITCFYLQ